MSITGKTKQQKKLHSDMGVPMETALPKEKVPICRDFLAQTVRAKRLVGKGVPVVGAVLETWNHTVLGQGRSGNRTGNNGMEEYSKQIKRERLAWLRENPGATSRQFADRFGVSQTYARRLMNRWEDEL